MLAWRTSPVWGVWQIPVLQRTGIGMHCRWDDTGIEPSSGGLSQFLACLEKVSRKGLRQRVGLWRQGSLDLDVFPALRRCPVINRGRKAGFLQ